MRPQLFIQCTTISRGGEADEDAIGRFLLGSLWSKTDTLTGK
jgi:hypothetical protein